MELPHAIIVAELVAPPAGDEIDALALHATEQFPSAVGSAGELFFSFCFGNGLVGSGLVCKKLYLRDAAKVALAVHDQRLEI